MPNSAEFKLAVVAQWRKLRKTPDSKSITTLWMRGSGPGLSWEKSTELKKTASSIDTWKAELSYTSGSDSLRCLSSSHCSTNQRALEFRLYRDELASEGMLGPNFFIPLPLSHSLSGTVDFLTPTVTVKPWFDGNKITVSSYIQTSSESVTGRMSQMIVKVSLLYPPSFEYNVRKTYQLVILFGKKEPMLVAPLLEHLFVHDATVKEVFVVVIGYLDKAPFCNSSPFNPAGTLFVCKSGVTCHDCQSCWDERRAERCDREEFIDKTNRCLKGVKCNGHGDEILDMIELDILPEIQERAQNRLLIDFPRNRLSIIGMDGAGLLACYAALTRPTIYANAGCMSAPFNWPLLELEKEFDPRVMASLLSRINGSIRRLPSLQMEYITQKYYVDNGDNDNFYFPSVDAHRYTEWFISRLQDDLGLRINENIVYAKIPGLSNSYYHHWYHGERVLHTLRYPLLYFFRAQGGPSKTYSRTLQITEESYAKRTKSYEELQVKHGGGEGGGGGGGGTGGGGGLEKSGDGKTLTSWMNNQSSFCTGPSLLDGESPEGGVPVPVFLAFTGRF